MNRVWEMIQQCQIVPAVKLWDAALAVQVAQALYDGGISVIEITFRTDAAAASIAAIRRALPQMLTGAGTVLQPEQAKAALQSGAEFIVAPGLNETVVKTVRDMGLVMLPGVATPSEIEAGLSMGLDAFKLFPAGALGGTDYLRAMAGPYAGVRFLPTGGVDASNLREYLSAGNVFAVGGSWLTPEKYLHAGEFDRITQLAREAVAIVKQTQGLDS